MGTKVKINYHFTARFDTRTMLSENTARMGDKAKPSGVFSERRRLCCLSRRSIQDQRNQTLNQHDCGHARDGKY
jgi:hypothetical protein